MVCLTNTTAIAFGPNRLEIAELQEQCAGTQRLRLLSVSTPRDAICGSSGVITNVPLLSECLHKALARRSVAWRRRVAIAIPTEVCFLRTFSVPQECAASPESWFRVHAQECLPCDPSLLVRSISITQIEDDLRSFLLVVAVRRSHLAPYIEIASALGGEISVIIPACIARWNAVRYGSQSLGNEPTALVHVSGESCELSMWDGDILLGTHSGIGFYGTPPERIHKLRSSEVWVESLGFPGKGAEDACSCSKIGAYQVVVRGGCLPDKNLPGDRAVIATLLAFNPQVSLDPEEPDFGTSGAYDAALGSLVATERLPLFDRSARA